MGTSETGRERWRGCWEEFKAVQQQRQRGQGKERNPALVLVDQDIFLCGQAYLRWLLLLLLLLLWRKRRRMVDGGGGSRWGRVGIGTGETLRKIQHVQSSVGVGDHHPETQVSRVDQTRNGTVTEEVVDGVAHLAGTRCRREVEEADVATRCAAKYLVEVNCSEKS